MKKSHIVSMTIAKGYGQVPNRSNIEAMRLVQKPASPWTIARLMAHEHNVTNGLHTYAQ